MDPGPKTRLQLHRLGRVWEQGQHVFVTGPTGSGKTALARHIVELRAQRGGHVIAFCMKPLEDETIVNEYLRKGFVRWNKYKKPLSHEKRVLIWPDVSKAKGNKDRIIAIQKPVFQDAFDGVNDAGHWTVLVDEGLYTVSPTFLNMGDDLAMSHAIGRSGKLTMVTLAQRPAHLPLILYGSASHAMVGRTRERDDVRRLSELGSREGSRNLAAKIADQSIHDFLWVPVAEDWPAEPLNLRQ
jgi:energy-coupling factor transporter ATP-binding protein EcfA2